MLIPLRKGELQKLIPAVATRDLPGSQISLGRARFFNLQASLTPLEITFTHSSIEGFIIALKKIVLSKRPNDDIHKQPFLDNKLQQ